ncbi:DUF6275 family protein [Enterococcus faecium]|uniref:DUF6275 family protein n=1 Tax=Enterococcus faecium TaxID=1352 RepID=UPI0021581E92|nr:DUF6275 family protein [Enterococcus faecium]
MDNEKFIFKCKQLVADYANENFDKTDQTQITVDNVFVVWSCKTLQNNKALLSTTVSDGMYYELNLGEQKDMEMPESISKKSMTLTRKNFFKK